MTYETSIFANLSYNFMKRLAKRKDVPKDIQEYCNIKLKQYKEYFIGLQNPLGNEPLSNLIKQEKDEQRWRNI